MAMAGGSRNDGGAVPPPFIRSEHGSLQAPEAQEVDAGEPLDGVRQGEQGQQGRNGEVEDPEGEHDDDDCGQRERVEHDVGRARQALGEPFGEPGDTGPGGAGGGHRAGRGAFPAGAVALALPQPLDDLGVGEAAAEAGVEDHPLPRPGVQVAGRGIARHSLGELLPVVLGHGRAGHPGVSERDYRASATKTDIPSMRPGTVPVTGLSESEEDAGSSGGEGRERRSEAARAGEG